jgi:hypothetical protein
MPSSYQVVLWKQDSLVVLRLLQIEFFRSLLGMRMEFHRPDYKTPIVISPIQEIRE